MDETRPREGASTLLKVKGTYGLRGGGAQEERSREASANGMWPIRTQRWPVWTKIWPIRTRGWPIYIVFSEGSQTPSDLRRGKEKYIGVRERCAF